MTVARGQIRTPSRKYEKIERGDKFEKVAHKVPRCCQSEKYKRGSVNEILHQGPGGDKRFISF